MSKVDDVWAVIGADDRVFAELYSHFTHDVPGAQFDRRVKRGHWDGQVHLFDRATGHIYLGLWQRVLEFCEERGYHFSFEDGRRLFGIEGVGYIDRLQTGREPRPYQREMFDKALLFHRALFVSPTASGKSLVIYYLAEFYCTQHNARTLLIVPRKGLVKQMVKDFESYGWEGSTHQIMEGAEKDSNADLVVATYQSIYKQPAAWFKQFKLVIGDEAHLFQARTLVALMKKTRQCEYKFGFTGTLDGSVSNQFVLEGLFGPVIEPSSTAEMMSDGFVSRLQIRCAVLKHHHTVGTYQEEMDYLCSSESRNRFLRNLVLNLKGNTLLLFQYVKKHGAILEEMIRSAAPDRPIYYVHGGVPVETREEYRGKIEDNENAIYIASFGTLSTGTNIPKLHNLVFASPSKSRIRNLQSIGRVLRLHETKDVATLYDVADDIGSTRERNYTLDHFIERIKIYAQEGFKYSMHRTDLS